MSESTRYYWKLQAQMRRKAYLDRISENTSRYHAKYAALLDDLIRQGLDQYMPEEFSRMRSALAELENLLHADPERGRTLSLQIGAEISRLPAMTRSTQRELESRERQRQQELSEMRRRATSELGQMVQSLIGNIHDPIEQDFAFDDLKAIQSEYAARPVDPQELPRIKSDLAAKVQSIRATALAKAKAWKERKVQETMRESQEMLISIHRDHAATDVTHNTKACQAMLSSLDAMRQRVAEQGCSMDDIQSQVAQAAENTDAAAADENCRRMVVRSIIVSLEKSGFVVGKPQRQTGEKDEVVILARKPAGAEATFRVTADGTMVYKFDHYEGMKCKTDIDQVLPMLQEIYGVELSDARVLWQNPDRISKSAKPLDEGNKGHSHG